MAEAPRPREQATISVDLDPVDTHLAGYGHVAPPDALTYAIALPRLLATFARHSVRATFFVLSRDVEGGPAWLRSIVDARHEVASHTIDHPPRLASRTRLELDEQLAT
jgi:Polysaccharide deacetylase